MVGYTLFKNKPHLALTLLLGFHGLLRTGELLDLQARHISISNPKGPAVISLGLTKSGKRQGAAESVTVYAEDVCRRLFQWKQTMPGHSFLAGPKHVWRKEFSVILKALKFDKWDFRPYSLRRGGATELFKREGAFDHLLVVGRWQSSRTARVYLNEGLSVLAELHLPWDKFSSTFKNQYLRSLTQNLPPLEPSTRKQSKSRGLGKTTRKPAPKEEKGKRKREQLLRPPF